MFSKTNTIAGLALLVLLLGLVIACGAAATATPTPSIKEQVQVGEGVEQEVTEEGAGATSTPAIKEQIQVGEEVGQDWSLTSLQTRMIKTGGRLVRHARRLVFQLAEVLVSREMLCGERIGRLRLAPG